MGTNGIPSDSTRIKIKEMFDKLGQSQRIEAKPTKITTDDIRNAMRNLDVKKQDSQDSQAFDLSKVSPEMLEKIKGALKNGDLSALDGLKGKSINKQEAPKTVDKLPTDVWQGPYTKDGPDIQLF